MLPVSVEDHEDGTYAGTYTVPRRGNYEVRLAAGPSGCGPLHPAAAW